MRLDRRLQWVIAGLMLAALACQAVLPDTKPTSQIEEAPVGGSTSTASPRILFEDDFSDTASGWEDYEDEEGVTGYRDGGYRIFINKADWYFWSTPGLNFSDVIVDVDATKVSGPDQNEFGVICRYQNADNFYLLSISSDGYYGISKLVNGNQTSVGVDEMAFNDTVIRTGAATNHIRASCIGDALSLEVNGQILADLNDQEFKAGDIGIIAGTYEELGTDIVFDNFVVTRP